LLARTASHDFEGCSHTKANDVRRDLSHVRTACRFFCTAATPFAFRIFSVVSTRGSARNLGQLFDVPDIATHVREAAYFDTGGDRKGKALK
ncbi:hypothetical protein H4582DRAFT_2131661, partial [Lactarius indigo]